MYCDRDARSWVPEFVVHSLDALQQLLTVIVGFAEDFAVLGDDDSFAKVR